LAKDKILKIIKVLDPFLVKVKKYLDQSSDTNANSQSLPLSTKIRHISVRDLIKDSQHLKQEFDVTKKLEEKFMKKVDVSSQSQVDFAKSPISVYHQQQRRANREKYMNDKKIMLDYRHGEEGHDFIKKPDDKQSFHYQLAEKYHQYMERKIQKKMPKGYQQMQKNGVFEMIHPKELIKEDGKQLAGYPGSAKGPHPKDDPEFYKKWLWENTPEPLKKAMDRIDGIIDDEESQGPSSRPTTGEDGKTSAGESATWDDANVAGFEPKNDPFHELQDSKFTYKYTDPNGFGEEGDRMYEDMHLTPEDQNAHSDSWMTFTSLPHIKKSMEMLSKYNPDDWILDPEAEAHYEKITSQPYYNSLWSYYNILPDKVRENHIVIDFFRLMEYSCPHWSLQDKQDSLNAIAYAALEPHDTVKAVLYSMLNINQKATLKEMKELLIRDELEFHEGGNTKKHRPPPEEYAKKLSVVEKIDEEHQMHIPWKDENWRADDTPTIPVFILILKKLVGVL
jgi:hypothetical protein